MVFKNIKTADDLAAEKEAADKTEQVSTALSYLNKTDWIIAKIGEARINGLDDSALIEKYADELPKREESRQLINQLEA